MVFLWGIPLLAKVVPRIGHFKIDSGELLTIILGYVIGFSPGDRIIIESDSLLVVRSLASHADDFSELGFLSSVFQSNIDVSSTSFSHVYRTGYSSTHLLAKAALFSNVPIAWTRNMPHDISHAILLDFNNI